MRSFFSASSVILLCLASLGSAAKLAPRYPVCDADHVCGVMKPESKDMLDSGRFSGTDLITCNYTDDSKCVFNIEYVANTRWSYKMELAEDYSEGPRCTEDDDRFFVTLNCKIDTWDH